MIFFKVEVPIKCNFLFPARNLDFRFDSAIIANSPSFHSLSWDFLQETSLSLQNPF